MVRPELGNVNSGPRCCAQGAAVAQYVLDLDPLPLTGAARENPQMRDAPEPGHRQLANEASTRDVELVRRAALCHVPAPSEDERVAAHAPSREQPADLPGPELDCVAARGLALDPALASWVPPAEHVAVGDALLRAAGLDRDPVPDVTEMLAQYSPEAVVRSTHRDARDAAPDGDIASPPAPSSRRAARSAAPADLGSRGARPLTIW
jgi:hypothetical protein